MDHNPSGILDQDSSRALSELEFGIEILRVPITQDNQLRVGAHRPNVFAEIEVAVEPSAITLKRIGEEPQPFGIIYETPYQPVEVLGRTVTSLTMFQHESSWRLRQDPHRLVEVGDSESFALFWRLVAAWVQKTRLKRQRASLDYPPTD